MRAYNPFEDGDSSKSRTRPDGSDDERHPRKRAKSAKSHFDEAPKDGEEPPPAPPVPKKPLRSHEETAALIGTVRDLSNPRTARLCLHFLKNDCLWGDQCRFSHSREELRAGVPPTEEMNFSNLDSSQETRRVAIPKPQLRFFMTDSTRRLLTEATGVADVEWDSVSSQVSLSGTAIQAESAEQMLRRAITHCNWGANEAKVRGLLSQQPRSSAKLLLSPMVPGLRQGSFNLSATKMQVTLGADSSNDLALKGPLISRSHALIEFMPNKGALYVVDLSTNGTFLNGVRLPAKSSGKVALFHGDELVFPEPDKPAKLGEFGYMVNLELI